MVTGERTAVKAPHTQPAERLLHSLFEYQQRQHPHEDMVLQSEHDITRFFFGNPALNTSFITAPAGMGRTLTEYLIPCAASNQTPAKRYGIILVPGVATDSAAFSVHQQKNGTAEMTLSPFHSKFTDPCVLFTEYQHTLLERYLSGCAGIVAVSAPTMGVVLAALAALVQLSKPLRQHTSKTPHTDISALMDVENIYQHTTGQLPPLTAVLLTPDQEKNERFWQVITEQAIAGSLVVVGFIDKKINELEHILRRVIPPFLQHSLLHGALVITPFPGACLKCALPIPLDSNMQIFLRNHGLHTATRGLKSAHASGCTHCNRTGIACAVPAIDMAFPIPTMSAQTKKPDSLLMTRCDARTDLIERAHFAPVSLERALAFLTKQQ